jgi:hypothetical protein
MPSEPHVCGISEVPLAAKTLTTMLNSTPAISFFYDNRSSATQIPYGKPEKLSTYLYRTLSTGLVLSVDDGDEKCVGVALWEGPTRERGLLGKVFNYCVQGGFDIWDSLKSIYYGDCGLNKKVRVQQLIKLIAAICGIL